jgi:hypothetical protein
MTGKLRVLAVLCALLPAACAQYTLVGPGPVSADGGLSIAPGIAWSKATGPTTGPSTETWTVDGLLLDALIVLGGIPDGKPLALMRGRATDNLAPFRSTMTANEIMDLYEATWSTLAKTSVTRTANLHPITFGGAPGFRFDASYTGQNEVEYQASVAGAVRDGKLYLIVYHATRLHYFPAYLAEFDRIVGSARLPGA